jgi:hypothetical protein
MTIHRQIITLTVFSHSPINTDVLEDDIKHMLFAQRAVVDVECGEPEQRATLAAENELWERGFDPDVMDGYNQKGNPPYTIRLITHDGKLHAFWDSEAQTYDEATDEALDYIGQHDLEPCNMTVEIIGIRKL